MAQCALTPALACMFMSKHVLWGVVSWMQHGATRVPDCPAVVIMTDCTFIHAPVNVIKNTTSRHRQASELETLEPSGCRIVQRSAALQGTCAPASFCMQAPLQLGRLPEQQRRAACARAHYTGARPVLDAAVSPFLSQDGYAANGRSNANGMRVHTKLKLFSGSANPVRSQHRAQHDPQRRRTP